MLASWTIDSMVVPVEITPAAVAKLKADLDAMTPAQAQNFAAIFNGTLPGSMRKPVDDDPNGRY